MENTNIFETIRKDTLIKYLKIKRDNMRDEDDLKSIDSKIKELEDDIIIINTIKSKDVSELFFEKLDIEVNKYALFKSWNKLTYDQKKAQLMVYIDNLIQADNIDHIKKVVIEYLDAGMIKSSKYIQYSSKEGKISSIKFLEYDNNTNQYTIQLKLKKTSSI